MPSSIITAASRSSSSDGADRRLSSPKIDEKYQDHTPKVEQNLQTVSYDGHESADSEAQKIKTDVADDAVLDEVAGSSKGNVDEAYKMAGEVAMTFTAEEERIVRRKIDWVVPVFCALIYFSQFLDKTLLNYAAILGLPIKGINFNLVSSGFYFGYFAFVFPTAWLAQRFPWGATKYLGVNVVLWGIVLALSAISGQFAPFMVLRILLGAFESTVTVVLLSTIVAFYKQEEQAVRIGAFYCMNGVTQMVGPLIAYGTTFYVGDSFGNEPWKLLYIIFGVFTVVVGILTILFMPSSPQQAYFLDERQKRIALERVRKNAAGTAQRQFKWSQAREAFFESRIWLMYGFVILTSIVNGGVSAFSSKIIKGFGYSSRETLLLTLPQGFLAAVFTLLCAWLSDKYRERILPIMVALLPTIVGAAILVGYGEDPSAHKAANVFASFISHTFGSSLSIVYAWNATNIGGSSKKGVVYAANMFAFAAGNIAGSYIFRDADAPQYTPGKVTMLVCLVVSAFMAVGLRMLVTRANAKKRAQVEALKAEHGWDEAEVQRQRDAYAFRDLTDRQNPFFVYAS